VSRFHEPQHPDFHRLNASLAFDRRLWPQDIAQSRAHARMLASRAIISAADRDELLAGLDGVELELAMERFVFDSEDEDIHMAIERRLGEIVGCSTVSPNSIDAVSERDFVLDYLNAAATCSTHLSRLGAELVLWFGITGAVDLPWRFALAGDRHASWPRL
jgi:argininosuccinate lyase